jgi:Xaa-Pro aminopeptidase
MAGRPYGERLAALREDLRPRQALVSGAPDALQFFTGYRGHGYLAVREDAARLFAYPVEYTRAAQEAAVEVVLARERPLPAALVAWTFGHEVFVDASLSWAAAAALGGVQDGEALLARHMAVKDAERLADFVTAASLARSAYAALLAAARPGMTERALAAIANAHCFAAGAERLAFDTIVASGPRSALCHGEPTDRPLEPGDLVLVDLGPAVGEGEADFSRTFSVGPATDRARQVYDAVARAQAAGVAAVRPGAQGAEVDGAARAVLARAGLADAMVHALGHSLGRGPNLVPGCQDVVVEGAVITVEPGVYLPGWGGVRLEDACVVGPVVARPIGGGLEARLVEISL